MSELTTSLFAGVNRQRRRQLGRMRARIVLKDGSVHRPRCTIDEWIRREQRAIAAGGLVDGLEPGDIAQILADR